MKNSKSGFKISLISFIASNISRENVISIFSKKVSENFC